MPFGTSPEIVEKLALRLRTAYSGGPVPPLRDSLAPDDVSASYAIQAANTTHWVNAGRCIVGRKVGLTARAVQVQLGVNQPDYGVLLDDMSIPDGGELLASRVLQPKAEAEVAMVLGEDLNDPEVTRDGVAAAVARAEGWFHWPPEPPAWGIRSTQPRGSRERSPLGASHCGPVT